MNDGNFKELVLESKVPVLVDFWAPWCGPCRMIAPLIDEIAAEYGDRLKAVSLPAILLSINNSVSEAICSVVCRYIWHWMVRYQRRGCKIRAHTCCVGITVQAQHR